jgi:CDP-diacylglycerol--serine O-phosphatidyltransferase
MAPDNKVIFGLASPAAAGTMTTLVWVSVDNFPPVEGIEISVSVGILTVLVALLMVCNVRYYSPKNLKGRVSFPMMLGAVLLFVVIATYPPGVLLCIGVVYGLSGPAQALIRFIRAKRH